MLENLDIELLGVKKSRLDLDWAILASIILIESCLTMILYWNLAWFLLDRQFFLNLARLTLESPGLSCQYFCCSFCIIIRLIPDFPYYSQEILARNNFDDYYQSCSLVIIIYKIMAAPISLLITFLVQTACVHHLWWRSQA